MASAIDANKPTGTFYGGDLRANLLAAKSEIETLQELVAGLIGALIDDPDPTLAADLNVNGKRITTEVTNGNVLIEANGGGVVRVPSAIIEMARQLRHVGNVSTWIIFETDDIAFGTADVARISINNLGVRFGSGGSRVNTILNAIGSNRADAIVTEQGIQTYVNANAGISSLSADPTPDLGGPLNGAGHPIINYTQPKVSSVTGTLTQSSHGGRPCHITGNITVPNTDGFVAELRNPPGGSTRTISPSGGVLIHEGVTKATISLPVNRSVVVAGDGTNVWAYGALA